MSSQKSPSPRSPASVTDTGQASQPSGSRPGSGPASGGQTDPSGSYRASQAEGSAGQPVQPAGSVKAAPASGPAGASTSARIDAFPGQGAGHSEPLRMPAGAGREAGRLAPPSAAPTSARDNVEVRWEGDKLILTIDCSIEGEPSASGKTMTVATTGGHRMLDEQHSLTLTLSRRPDGQRSARKKGK